MATSAITHMKGSLELYHELEKPLAVVADEELILQRCWVRSEFGFRNIVVLGFI